jgi:hypothetical protein
MRKLMLISLATLAGLVVAAPGVAKEMTLFQVCGTNGCNAIKPGKLPNHDGGLQSASTPALQGYYLLKVGAGDGQKILDRFEMYYVRGGSVIGMSGDEGWAAFPSRVARRIDAATNGLKPFGLPQVKTVYVNQHRSLDAAPYIDLMGPLDKTEIPSSNESPIMISLIWRQPSPWSNDGALLGYLPRSKVLMRSDGYFQVPRSLAQRIDRERRGLPPVAPGDGFPWGIFVGALAGALVLVTVATALVYRRRRPGPAERAVPA